MEVRGARHYIVFGLENMWQRDCNMIRCMLQLDDPEPLKDVLTTNSG